MDLFFIENEKELKIGNSIKTKNFRYDNQINKIIRNLIQEILLDWINYKENDSSKILYKINPIILKKNNFKYFKGKKLKDIYSNEISIKDKKTKKIKDNDHNIIIINDCNNKIKNFKLNLLFEQALKLFLDKNNVKEGFSYIINLDENKISKSELLGGLKGKEEYINIKGRNYSFKQKLGKVFDKIRDIFFN